MSGKRLWLNRCVTSEHFEGEKVQIGIGTLINLSDNDLCPPKKLNWMNIFFNIIVFTHDGTYCILDEIIKGL